MSLSGTFPVIRFASTPSTNEVAMQLALQGGEHGTVVVAEQQVHGRGRGAKDFSSPPGGLYMSVILRPELSAELLPLITLAGGLACASAVEEQTDLTVALKWPNDLYLRGRKLGGILAQSAPYSPAAHGIPFVVLGIGINVNTSQETFHPELIVRKIVEEHGGRIEADNRAEGGARVRIDLPLNGSSRYEVTRREQRWPESRRERA